MSRRVLINLAAFLAVFVLMIWWALNNILFFDFIERPYQIQGEFAATAGVAENSEVAYLGVNYGSVRSVEMEPDPETGTSKVLITMDIDRDKEIPLGSRARIFRKSAVGEPYIDFDPPDDYQDGDPVMPEGHLVPLEDTQVPLEFSELLRTASQVLSNVDPDQTRTLIHELAVGLKGRGDSLRNLTVSSDALLQTFAARTELLDSLSENNTRLTRTVTERRGSLSSAITDLAAVADTLREVEPATNVLLERGTELLGQTADLVADTKQNLDCVLHDLDDVIDVTTTDDNLDGLEYLLQNGPTAFGYVFMTRDDEPGGLWVRVNLLVETASPAQQYVPPTELPAVPEVPPCVSTLSTGGDLRFESAGAPGTAFGTNLPATGGDSRRVVVSVLVAAALAGLVARRRADT